MKTIGPTTAPYSHPIHATPVQSPAGGRRAYSTRELQAAAAALAQGRFAGADRSGHASAVVTKRANNGPLELDLDLDLGELDGCGGREPDGPAQEPMQGPAQDPARDQPRPSGLLVRVRAASSGAGASTIALAITDAVAAAGASVRLLDAAAPAWSGLAGVTATEAGASAGWRRGQRPPDIVVDRVAEPHPCPDRVPAPRECSPVTVTVLDTGWSVRELTAGGGSWLTNWTADVEVVVTRASESGLNQAEMLLASCANDHSVLVVVGASRWVGRSMGPVLASVGPHLRALHAEDAIVGAPLLSPKSLPGLGTEPLPKSLAKPLAAVANRLLTHARTPLLPAGPPGRFRGGPAGG